MDDESFQVEQFEAWRQRIEALIQRHPLQIISWEATRRCNLNCLHCGSPSETVPADDELTANEVVSAFEQIERDFDMSEFRHINITGGEPFVRRDLLDILTRISRFPVYRNIDIQTNGWVLASKPDLLGALKQVGVTGLGVSIDGLKEKHDAFRRRDGSFDRAWRTARMGVEAGYVVTVSMVAHAKNVDEIPDLYARVKEEIRPRVFRIMTLDSIGRAEHDAAYLLSAPQFRQVIEFLKIEYQAHCAGYADPRSMMVELGCGGWMGTDLEGMFRPMIFHCIAGINNLGILCDGKLASCSNIPRDFIEGDLRKERIRDVWDHRYHRYRSFNWKKTGPCIACDQWIYCHGGPMHKRRPDGSLLECLWHSLHIGNAGLEDCT